MSKDIPEADIYEWCERRNYALVAREDFPYLFKDIVKCGECKYEYSCGHQIKRNGLTLKLTRCEYGERKNDEPNT